MENPFDLVWLHTTKPYLNLSHLYLSTKMYKMKQSSGYGIYLSVQIQNGKQRSVVSIHQYLCDSWYPDWYMKSDKLVP